LQEQKVVAENASAKTKEEEAIRQQAQAVLESEQASFNFFLYAPASTLLTLTYLYNSNC
jgi:hypothetical protein